MDSYEKVRKGFLDSLNLLDIPIIKFIVLGGLILYNTLLIPEYNNEVSKWFSWFWFKLLFLLITIWIACKDKTISLLMSIAFVLSVLKINNSNNINYTELDLNMDKKKLNLNIKELETFDEDNNVLHKDNNVLNVDSNDLNVDNNVLNVDNNVLHKDNNDLNVDNNDLNVDNNVLHKDNNDLNVDNVPSGNSGIIGYEECYNNCNTNKLTNSCSSIKTWGNNEIGTQGLNCKTPGWAGIQIGANINNIIN